MMVTIIILFNRGGHCFQATVLEEMPPFPERESSILAKLKKKRPDKVSILLESKAPGRETVSDNNKQEPTPSNATTTTAVQNHVIHHHHRPEHFLRGLNNVNHCMDHGCLDSSDEW